MQRIAAMFYSACCFLGLRKFVLLVGGDQQVFKGIEPNINGNSRFCTVRGAFGIIANNIDRFEAVYVDARHWPNDVCLSGLTCPIARIGREFPNLKVVVLTNRDWEKIFRYNFFGYDNCEVVVQDESPSQKPSSAAGNVFTRAV
jgi:hypothetical protein